MAELFSTKSMKKVKGTKCWNGSRLAENEQAPDVSVNPNTGRTLERDAVSAVGHVSTEPAEFACELMSAFALKMAIATRPCILKHPETGCLGR
jgi:hypothetical protein